MFKKRLFLITISILLTMSVLVLHARQKNYVKLSDIDKPRKIALASFMIKKDMLDTKYDKVKHLNGEIFSEYIVSNFVNSFNIDESYVSLIPLEKVLPKKIFDTIPQTFSLTSEYVSPLGYITTDDVSDEVLAALEGKVDSIMFTKVHFSLWSQRIFINFSVYDLNRELVWRDTFDGTSKHIIADTSITPKTSYNVVLQNVKNQQKRYDDEVYIVLNEAIQNSIDNMAKKFPMIFSTNDYFKTIKTFSLTNKENQTNNNNTTEVD